MSDDRWGLGVVLVDCAEYWPEREIVVIPEGHEVNVSPGDADSAIWTRDLAADFDIAINIQYQQDGET